MFDQAVMTDHLRLVECPLYCDFFDAGDDARMRFNASLKGIRGIAAAIRLLFLAGDLVIRPSLQVSLKSRPLVIDAPISASGHLRSVYLRIASTPVAKTKMDFLFVGAHDGCASVVQFPLGLSSNLGLLCTNSGGAAHATPSTIRMSRTAPSPSAFSAS